MTFAVRAQQGDTVDQLCQRHLGTTAGVTEVTDCERDTYSDPEHFYSYRRDKVTGRHGAFICKR